MWDKIIQQICDHEINFSQEHCYLSSRWNTCYVGENVVKNILSFTAILDRKLGGDGDKTDRYPMTFKVWKLGGNFCTAVNDRDIELVEFIVEEIQKYKQPCLNELSAYLYWLKPRYFSISRLKIKC